MTGSRFYALLLPPHPPNTTSGDARASPDVVLVEAQRGGGSRSANHCSRRLPIPDRHAATADQARCLVPGTGLGADRCTFWEARALTCRGSMDGFGVSRSYDGSVPNHATEMGLAPPGSITRFSNPRPRAAPSGGGGGGDASRKAKLACEARLFGRVQGCRT